MMVVMALVIFCTYASNVRELGSLRKNPLQILDERKAHRLVVRGNANGQIKTTSLENGAESTQAGCYSQSAYHDDLQD